MSNEINSVNNRNVSQFRTLAERLDAADGKIDGKIEASVWNEYLDSVGSKGNKIKNYINIENATKSFNYYDKKKDAGNVDWKNWESQLDNYLGKNKQTEISPQPAVKPQITGPSPKENPEYDAIIRCDGEEFQAHPAVKAPVTGPSPKENPEYDAIIHGKGIDTQTNPSVKTNPPQNDNENKKNEKNKPLTKEDIQNTINNLKPGESFKYEETFQIPGMVYERSTVRWKRNEDGTLTKTKPTITNRLGRTFNLSTVYSQDNKQKLSEDFILNESIPRVATKHYDSNGNISSITMNLNKLPLNNNSGNLDSLGYTIIVAEKSSEKCTEQKFTNTQGETLVYCKDATFFNAKGNKISKSEAYSILKNNLTSGNLNEFIQIPLQTIEN